ncbi:MAG: type II/IV secretion system protein, partial [Gammaproteobacteria bacterium]
TRETLDELASPWRVSGGTVRAYKPVGCIECRMTGYRGRTGLYELMMVSESFRGLLGQAPDIGALRRQAVADGMRPLRLAGLLRVAEGLTTVAEVLAATPALQERS